MLSKSRSSLMALVGLLQITAGKGACGSCSPQDETWDRFNGEKGGYSTPLSAGFGPSAELLPQNPGKNTLLWFLTKVLVIFWPHTPFIEDTVSKFSLS